MTWIRCSGYFSTIERTRRWTNGFCDVTWRVSSRVPGSNCAIAARGSIAVGCRRWFTNRWLTTTSASWKTLSTSPPRQDPLERHIVRRVAVERCPARLRRGFDVSDHGQRIVLDLDEVASVFRDEGTLGDDDRHGFSRVPDDLPSERRIRGRLQVRGRERPCGNDVADLILQVLGCEDIEDSGKASCLRRVDRTDSRMRIGTSDELCENGP